MDSDFMQSRELGQLTHVEIRAIWAYLQWLN
jgi:hypothetical protein